MKNRDNKNIKNIVVIVIITIIVLIVAIFFATRDNYSYTKKCLYSPSETENKVKEVAKKYDDHSYYYKEKHHVSLNDDSLSIIMYKEEYDEKALYEFVSLFVDIDEETLIKIINNSLKYNEMYEKDNYMFINTDKYGIYISVTNRYVHISIDLCVYSFDDLGYSTDIVDENNIKEYDVWLLQKFFNIDFKYSDLIVYLSKEANDNGEEALLEVEDEYNTRILLGKNRIYYANNYDYLYKKLVYGVTHGILDYKEKLEKDFTYLKTYFNYEDEEYISKITNIIESGKYKEKGRYIKNENYGNYYDYYIDLDNNCGIELKVYDDKIYFEFSFKE